MKWFFKDWAVKKNKDLSHRIGNIIKSRDQAINNSLKNFSSYKDDESLLETLNFQTPESRKIQVEPFLSCLTLTDWGCFFLREKNLLPYLKDLIKNSKNEPNLQKKVLVLLSQVAGNPLGAELLAENPDLLEELLNKFDQKKNRKK